MSEEGQRRLPSWRQSSIRSGRTNSNSSLMMTNTLSKQRTMIMSDFGSIRKEEGKSTFRKAKYIKHECFYRCDKAMSNCFHGIGTAIATNPAIFCCLTFFALLICSLGCIGIADGGIYQTPYRQWTEEGGDQWYMEEFMEKLNSGHYVYDYAKYDELKKRQIGSERAAIMQAETKGANLLSREAIQTFYQMEMRVLNTTHNVTYNGVEYVWGYQDLCAYLAPDIDYELYQIPPCILLSPTMCFQETSYRVDTSVRDVFKNDTVHNETYEAKILSLFPYLTKDAWGKKPYMYEKNSEGDTVSDNPQDSNEIDYLTRAYYQCLLYTVAPALPMFVIAGKMIPDRTEPTVEKIRSFLQEPGVSTTNTFNFLMDVNQFDENKDFVQIEPVMPFKEIYVDDSPTGRFEMIDTDNKPYKPTRMIDGEEVEGVLPSDLYAGSLESISAWRLIVNLAKLEDIAHRFQVNHGLCSRVETIAPDYKGYWDCPEITDEIRDKARDLLYDWSEKFGDEIEAVKDTQDMYSITRFTMNDVDELVSAISSGLAAPVIIGIFLLCLWFILFQCRADCLRSRVCPSCCSIFFSFLTITASIGLCVAFQPLTGGAIFTVPFLGLALGAQQVFIMNRSFPQASEHLEIEELTTSTAIQTGPAISMVAFVNCVLFLLGAFFIPVYELQATCVVMFLQQFFIWFAIFFAILPILVIDARRQNKRRYDCCCCWEVKDYDERAQELTLEKCNGETKFGGSWMDADSYLEYQFYDPDEEGETGRKVVIPEQPWKESKNIIQKGNILTWDFAEYEGLQGEWKAAPGVRMVEWCSEGSVEKLWIKQSNHFRIQCTRKVVNCIANPICNIVFVLIKIGILVGCCILALKLEPDIDMLEFVPKKTKIYEFSKVDKANYNLISGNVGCCHDGKGDLETNTDFGRDFEDLFRFHWEKIDSDYSRWSNNWLSDFNDWSGFLSFGELPNDGGENPNEYLYEYESIRKQLIEEGMSPANASNHQYEYKHGPYPKGNVKPMYQIYINEDPVYAKWEQCETGNLATCHQGPPPAYSNCIEDRQCRDAAGFRAGNLGDFPECAEEHGPDYPGCCVALVGATLDIDGCSTLFGCKEFWRDRNACVANEYTDPTTGSDVGYFAGRMGYSKEWMQIDPYRELGEMSIQDCLQACRDDEDCYGAVIDRDRGVVERVADCDLYNTMYVVNSFTKYNEELGWTFQKAGDEKLFTPDVTFVKQCKAADTEAMCTKLASVNCVWSETFGSCIEQALSCNSIRTEDDCSRYRPTCVWNATNSFCLEAATQCLDPDTRYVGEAACFWDWIKNYTRTPIQKMFTPEIYFKQPDIDHEPYAYASNFYISTDYRGTELTTDKIRDALKHMNNIVAEPRHKELGLFYYSPAAAVYFQLDDIEDRLVTFEIIAIVVIFFASMVFLLDPRAAFIFVFVQVCTVIEVLGLCQTVEMDINGAFFMNVIIANAVSVGYGALLNRQYMLALGTSYQRLETAFVEMFWPSLGNVATIIISVIFLSQSRLEYMRKYLFNMFLIVAVIGYFNNMIFQSIYLMRSGIGSLRHLEKKLMQKYDLDYDPDDQVLPIPDDEPGSGTNMEMTSVGDGTNGSTIPVSVE